MKQNNIDFKKKTLSGVEESHGINISELIEACYKLPIPSQGMIEKIGGVILTNTVIALVEVVILSKDKILALLAEEYSAEDMTIINNALSAIQAICSNVGVTGLFRLLTIPVYLVGTAVDAVAGIISGNVSRENFTPLVKHDFSCWYGIDLSPKIITILQRIEVSLGTFTKNHSATILADLIVGDNLLLNEDTSEVIIVPEFKPSEFIPIEPLIDITTVDIVDDPIANFVDVRLEKDLLKDFPAEKSKPAANTKPPVKDAEPYTLPD